LMFKIPAIQKRYLTKFRRLSTRINAKRIGRFLSRSTRIENKPTVDAALPNYERRI
jgi:hypothetical protein